jgi:hypothetical protein
LAYLRVQEGDTFALHRLQHFTSPAKKPSVSLVVDVCGKSLADVATYTKDAFESVAFAAAAAPVLDEWLTPPLTKQGLPLHPYPFLEQKDPEQVRREAQHQAEFEATMEPSRELHEAEKVAKDAVEHKLLMELLEQPVAEMAKQGG